MANSYFDFKQFGIHQDRCAMKVTTDACLFGAWCANEMENVFQQSQKHVLDIGAGTGLLSLMIAQKTMALLDAVEIDGAAVQQASENSEASPWAKRINLIHADVLQWQPSYQYDYIISNPPFYENDLKSDRRAKNIAHHDAGLRLNGLLRFIKEHLKEDGSTFLLLPAKRLMEAERIMRESGLHLHQKVMVKQTPKHEPFRVMMEGKKDKAERTIESVITIADDRGYTSEFISLLKDYYLYL